MATQLLNLVGFQKHSKTAKMTLRRAKLHSQDSHYAYMKITGSENVGDYAKEKSKGREKIKRRKKGKPGAAREVPYLNLWYFASTISHILRKTKAFYNECCCDAYDDRTARKVVEVTVVDPYFSVPAFPCTSVVANCM